VGGQQSERRVRRWCICGGACRTIVPDGARGSVMGISSYIANPVQPARRWLQPCTLSSCYLRHRCPNVHLYLVRRLLGCSTPPRPHRCIPTVHRPVPVLGRQKYHIRPPSNGTSCRSMTSFERPPQGPQRSSATHVIRLHQSPQKDLSRTTIPSSFSETTITTRGRETHLTVHTSPGGDALMVQ